MTGQRSFTFKNLQDEALSLLGFRNDTGNMRELVKERIRANHDSRVNQGEHNFMVFPYPTTFTLTPGVRDYALHGAFRAPIYFRSRTTGEDLMEWKSDMLLDEELPAYDSTGGAADFQLRGVMTVQNLPTAAGTVAITSSDAGADAGKTVTITGETSSGAVVEETIAVSATGSTSFARVLGIRKDGEDWTGTMTATHGGSTVLIELGPEEFGKEFRHFYLLRDPEDAEVIEYSFYRFGNRLEDDNDVPSIPAPFSRILVYDALLDLQGYARFSSAETQRFADSMLRLEQDLFATYEEGQSKSAKDSYVHFIRR